MKHEISVTGRNFIQNGTVVMCYPPDGETPDFKGVVIASRMYSTNRIMYTISNSKGEITETDEDHVDVFQI